MRSGSAHCDLEFAIGGRGEGGREEGKKGRRKATLIKSKDPHLAGGGKKYAGKRTKQCGGWEVSVPDTRNSRYGTEIGEVRHGRNCSSKTLWIYKEELTRSSYKNFL